MWELSPRVKVEAPAEYAAGWDKQRRAAAEILRRFVRQPGVILADQVGMGKTFTALAVAVSAVLADSERPVVILVPKAVGHKWINDWNRFARTYLDPDTAREIRGPQEPIVRPGAFFSALAEPPESRRHLLVVTHQALSNNAIGQFAEIAAVWAATGGADCGDEGWAYRRQFAKWSGRREWAVTGRGGFTRETVSELLQTSPELWRRRWEELTGRNLPWDPVPAAVMRALNRLDLAPVLELLDRSPKRRSVDEARDAERLAETGGALKDLSRRLWQEAMAGVDSDLSLLILDEAHHTKNHGTQLSRLFAAPKRGTPDGILYRAADRMLFLTATPFELGHDELLRILGRFTAALAQGLPDAFTDETQHELRSSLISARRTSRQLERSWGRVTEDDVRHFDTWTAGEIPDDLPADVRTAWGDAQRAVAARKRMNDLVRTWVIRHERPRNRKAIEGARVIPGVEAATGIPIDDELALPFLLAARIHSLASRGSTNPPNFAYGIASSFEAYLRLSAGDGTDADGFGADDPVTDDPGLASASEPSALDAEIRWYDERVRAAIGIGIGIGSGSGARVAARHPKVEATTRRVMDHWLRREKVVVFCWFRRTTRAVHSSIEAALRDEIRARGARAFGVDPADGEEVDKEYLRLANRLFRRDTSSRTNLAYRKIRDELEEHFQSKISPDAHPELASWTAEAVIRNFRTPQHLARVDGLTRDLDANGILADFFARSPSGRSLANAWTDFIERVDSPSGHPELFRDLLGRDLEMTPEPTPDDEPDRTGESGRGSELGAVGIADGDTDPEIRRRRASVFTTPSAPEVLVAGSVMGEGIDLHTECDVVIHHDLDWNPGVIEQRTGRIERIGSLAERRGTGITVYVPYLAGTHDEKQFRVVRDRQQWFDLVMGSRPDGGLEDTQEEDRVPLAQPIVEAMALDLSVD
ncbi:helicase-related protein [Dietzia cinnamea]|uniref:helicase-related protein n=1 Tax=Dietzia cinnamea TaxID=321318 RepID=UPI0021A57C4B|nr:helicase-related protein [Dietzia cinnamea]MCT2140210.1 SNF2-related protein [Dietzia cinnamea]